MFTEQLMQVIQSSNEYAIAHVGLLKQCEQLLQQFEQIFAESTRLAESVVSDETKSDIKSVIEINLKTAISLVTSMHEVMATNAMPADFLTKAVAIMEDRFISMMNRIESIQSGASSLIPALPASDVAQTNATPEPASGLPSLATIGQFADTANAAPISASGPVTSSTLPPVTP